ncbi:DNA binding domain protein, excisionase family [mine drainage metagenome]|uniref:DNA binding domain protein, excisionase family n=1 Tax=mine drainage metagenome TaxID=410659 RepID=T1CK38_9ZZZZ
MGVWPETLRRWEAEGKIEPPLRTPGGRRRYDLAKLRGLAPHKASSLRMTLLYARVSSHDQKENLARQVALLESFSAANGWNYEVLQDLGSGLNYHKKGLRLLIKRICSNEVGRLVITHKDRLLRFGSELVFSLCEHFGTEVVVINARRRPSKKNSSRMSWRSSQVFSARLYGSRSHKNKQVLDALRDAAKQVSS